MYLGRYKVGEIVPVTVVTTPVSEVPTEPDQCPSVIVYSTAGPLDSLRMVIVDRFAVTALFFAPVFVHAEYSAGYHHAVACWKISGSAFEQTFTFCVTAGGHRDGPILALGEMSFPAVSYLLGQTRLGRIRKFKNPRTL